MSYALTGMDWLLKQSPDFMAEAEEYANQLYQDGYCIEHDENFETDEGCPDCNEADTQEQLFKEYWHDTL